MDINNIMMDNIILTYIVLNTTEIKIKWENSK